MTESTKNINSIMEYANVFELLPGKVLSVEINYPTTVKIKLHLIGYVLGQYIILKYPDELTLGSYKDVLVKDNVIIVRYLLEGGTGECVAFRTTIDQVTHFPEHLLILNFPSEFEHRQLRSQQRINTHLPASIEHNGSIFNSIDPTNARIHGIISDISLKGCGFGFKAEHADVKLSKNDVFICIQNELMGEIKIPAVICNSRNENGKAYVGIQFTGAEKQISDLLEHLFIDSTLL